MENTGQGRVKNRGLGGDNVSGRRYNSIRGRVNPVDLDEGRGYKVYGGTSGGK